jgi:hypothetical protein
MDNIINRIVTNPVNITWVGIGSAVIRNTNPENMQQLPPFIENLYNNSNVSMRLINFDPEFEKPYFLTTYYNNLSHVESTSEIDIYTIKLDTSLGICDLCEIYETYLNKWHKNNIEDTDLDIYPYDYERIDNVTIITYNTNYIQYKIELTNNNFSIQVKIYLINLFNNYTEGNI